MRKPVNVTVLVLAIASLLVGFLNCGVQKSLVKELNNKSSCKIPDMLPVFANGFHQYLRGNQCVDCHSDGPRNFAATDTITAFNAFVIRGPDKLLAEMSSDASHNNIATAPHIEPIRKLRDEWVKAQSNIICTNGDEISQQSAKIDVFVDSGMGRNIVRSELLEQDEFGNKYMKEWETLEWDIDGVPGGKIKADIKVNVGRLGTPTSYSVTNLSIKNPNVSVKIINIQILLNGSDYGVTTFGGVDADVPPSDNYQQLNPGASEALYTKDLSVDEDYSNDDAWTIEAETFEIY